MSQPAAADTREATDLTDVTSISDDELSEIIEQLRWAQSNVRSHRDLPGPVMARREWADHGVRDLRVTVERTRELQARVRQIRRRRDEAEARRLRLAELAGDELPGTPVLNRAGSRELARVARALNQIRRETEATARALTEQQDRRADTVPPLTRRRDALAHTASTLAAERTDAERELEAAADRAAELNREHAETEQRMTRLRKRVDAARELLLGEERGGAERERGGAER